MDNETCYECKTVFSRTKPSISCNGFCRREFHISCVGVPHEILKLLKTPGLCWYCPNCTELKENYKELLKENLEKKVSEIISNVVQTFSEVKTEIVNNVEKKLEKLSSSTLVQAQKTTYANIVSKNIAISVKPKNTDQTNLHTKLKIKESVNPVDNNIKLSQVKNLKDGGILIRCHDVNDLNKFKEVASKSLSEEYEVKEVKRINPRIKVVGMTEEYSRDDLAGLLQSQNQEFGDDALCRVLKVWPTKRRNDMYQAIVDIDPATYTSILSRGFLLVNLDNCIVYDGVDVKLCFKCCGVNHYAKYCKATLICCPRCSESHTLSECKSEVTKCANCVKSRLVNVDHAAYEYSKCSFYKAKVNQLKSSFVNDHK